MWRPGNGCKDLEMSSGSQRQLSVGKGSQKWVSSVEKHFRVRGTVLVEQALWDKWPASLQSEVHYCYKKKGQ